MEHLLKYCVKQIHSLTEMFNEILRNVFPSSKWMKTQSCRKWNYKILKKLARWRLLVVCIFSVLNTYINLLTRKIAVLPFQLHVLYHCRRLWQNSYTGTQFVLLYFSFRSRYYLQKILYLYYWFFFHHMCCYSVVVLWLKKLTDFMN